MAAVALRTARRYRACVRMEYRDTLGDGPALKSLLVDLLSLRTVYLLRRATREDGHWDLLLLVMELRMRLVVS